MRVPTGFTGRVAAGAIAERYLKMAYGVEIVAFVSSVGKVELPSFVAPPSQVPEDDDDSAQAYDVVQGSIPPDAEVIILSLLC